MPCLLVEAADSEMVDFQMILIGGRIFVIFWPLDRYVCTVICANIGKH